MCSFDKSTGGFNYPVSATGALLIFMDLANTFRRITIEAKADSGLEVFSE